MKKNILSFLLLFVAFSANAQLVEYYENPQRFQFTHFDHDGVVGMGGWASDEWTNDTVFYSKICKRDNTHSLVYGIAIPYRINDSYYNFDTNEYYNNNNGLLNNVLMYYDTSNSTVIIGNATNRIGYDYILLARTSLRIGESAMIGNYFKMPNSDSSIFADFGSIYSQVLEVYFDQPLAVEDRYVIGLNLNPITILNMVDCGPLWVVKGPSANLGFPGSDTIFFSKIVDSSFINITQINNLPPVYYRYWGAPFPIVTPPPCMPPIWLKVTEQHRQSATIQWRAQYANTEFEVEYGPRGFAEGTGTTVGPVTPDAQYNGQVTLSGLAMDADYTVRVRSYCNVTNGYSDWTELDFHADVFYNVNTSTNNDSWGYVTGGGEYLAGTTARLFAYPRSEYCPFLNWSDGSNQNPRVLTVTRDTSFLAIFGCDSVGINTVDGFAAVTVTPNPASAEVVVRSSQPIATCTLYDIQGRAIATVAPAATTAVIDLRDLRPALYILAVSTDSGTVIKKIVKN